MEPKGGAVLDDLGHSVPVSRCIFLSKDFVVCGNSICGLFRLGEIIGVAVLLVAALRPLHATRVADVAIWVFREVREEVVFPTRFAL